ncbi:MAG: MBL fold metallo-hydrolase [Fimbriimonadaceae bacterium]|nr:MBL fold metallo-hydrolase [Fimbriimonadaceae bacterium]
MSASITFMGAAQTVTGSKHLIETNGKRILVDCGLFQGGKQLRALNWKGLPIAATDIDAVILTHAHTDHIGYLPRLIKQGFRGPVYATRGTIGLCKISLPDSGRLQEEDADRHNRKGTSRHAPALPLYTEADAYDTLKKLVPVHFHQFQELPGGGTFQFIPAGHILGSAFAEIYFENGERILMSGDLGRYDRPLLVDPEPVDWAEYLVIESTYGDRLHSVEDTKARLEEMANWVFERGSALLVPSFAIGRTQEMLYYVNELRDEGRLPKMPIYVDSPMATATTLLYVDPSDDMDPDLKIDLREGNSPFSRDLVRFVRDRGASKALNDYRGPMIIIAGSGMLNGGRMLHHVLHRVSDPDTLLLFTGYQAGETVGRQFLEGADTVSIFGNPIDVRCRVEKLNSLSAHADQGEIMRWLGNFRTPPKKTFIVHGEYPVQQVLRDKIKQDLGWDAVEIPAMDESFELF